MVSGFLLRPILSTTYPGGERGQSPLTYEWCLRSLASGHSPQVHPVPAADFSEFPCGPAPYPDMAKGPMSPEGCHGFRAEASGYFRAQTQKGCMEPGNISGSQPVSQEKLSPAQGPCSGPHLRHPRIPGHPGEMAW